MRVVKESLALLLCLFGGGVLASFVLVAAATLYFGVRFHDFPSFDAQVSFLERANPIALAIGGTVGALVYLRGRWRAKSRGANHDA